MTNVKTVFKLWEGLSVATANSKPNNDVEIRDSLTKIKILEVP